MSASGRIMAFSSLASNLVPGDTNGVNDIFIRNRRTKRTKRVSVSSSGAQANGSSHRPEPVIAAERFVGFWSFASNLVRGDTNRVMDAFVSDFATGRTRRVSVGAHGQRNGPALSPGARLSADGRFTAFGSLASNLVPGDSNGKNEVFVRGPLR